MLNELIAKNTHLINQDTDALCLFDGDDSMHKGVMIETYANRLIVSTRDKVIPEQLKKDLIKSNKTVYWKQLDQHKKDNPIHLAGTEQNLPFIAKESGVHYKISFQSGYSQGIFLDQRDNRKRVSKYSNHNTAVLNTFAYTGAFSVCAALAGATTTTLDLSQPYLDWAKENMQANGINPENHYFCKGDTFHWLKRFAKQNRTFDGIILDPPTFSRDDKGKVFRAEKNYPELLALAKSCLAKNGWILACTNCRKIYPDTFEQQARSVFPEHFEITPLLMPEEYTNIPYLKSLWIEAT